MTHRFLFQVLYFIVPCCLILIVLLLLLWVNCFTLIVSYVSVTCIVSCWFLLLGFGCTQGLHSFESYLWRSQRCFRPQWIWEWVMFLDFLFMRPMGNSCIWGSSSTSIEEPDFSSDNNLNILGWTVTLLLSCPSSCILSRFPGTIQLEFDLLSPWGTATLWLA